MTTIQNIRSRCRCRFLIVFAVLVYMGSATAQAQEEVQDPTQDSRIIEETLSKIRQVAELDKYIGENTTLREENNQLKQAIASLEKQVNQLTEELKVENERLRRQLVQLPTFEVKSKLVGASRSIAILQFSDRTIRIRQGIELSVPVADGVWTLMKVRNISNEFIELEFPELERTVILYD